MGFAPSALADEQPSLVGKACPCPPPKKIDFTPYVYDGIRAATAGASGDCPYRKRLAPWATPWEGLLGLYLVGTVVFDANNYEAN